MIGTRTHNLIKIPALKIAYLSFFLVFLVGAVALVRDTAYNGHDFLVFWRAGHYVLNGEPAYSITRDGGMVFKYPPWLIPFFFPFSTLPLEFAKWIWGIVEVLALISVIIWLISIQKSNPVRTLLVAMAYWGLWAVHAIDGQISLVMLAVCLWGFHATPNTLLERFGLKSFAITVSLTTKIFSIFPLLFTKPSINTIKTFAKISGILIVLTIPAWWVTPNRSVSALIHSWAESAGSGGKLLDQDKTRGRTNPGLPGFFLRQINFPVDDPRGDLIAFLTLALALGSGWNLLSRSFSSHSPRKAWVGWLGLTPVVHPLPWNHLFVFSFPLAVVALESALMTRKRTLIFVTFVGIALITVSTEKVLGSIGLFLESNSAKSWGVLICTTSLVYANQISPQGIRQGMRRRKC